MKTDNDSRLRIAAISFLNTAPLMWDFQHPPYNAELAGRYRIDWMLPSACADQLASGQADLGLVPIAALPVNPTLRILPGCTIASKDRVRSLLFVHRASQPLQSLRSVAADTASRSTLAHTRILLTKWGNPTVPFLPMKADLGAMLARADAAILIGDPALTAMEAHDLGGPGANGELVYLDLAEEWRKATGLPFVAAIWGCAARGGSSVERIAEDCMRSRDHGLENIDLIAAEWTNRIGLAPTTIRRYFTENIHYTLDKECVEAMRLFFRLAAECGALPAYNARLDGLAR